MTHVKFTGHQELTYLGYVDEINGGVLICRPGGDYVIRPVGAGIPDIPTDDRFILVEDEIKEEEEEAAADEDSVSIPDTQEEE